MARPAPRLWSGWQYNLKSKGGLSVPDIPVSASQETIGHWVKDFVHDRPNTWFVILATEDLFVMRWMSDKDDGSFLLEIYGRSGKKP